MRPLPSSNKGRLPILRHGRAAPRMQHRCSGLDEVLAASRPREFITFFRFSASSDRIDVSGRYATRQARRKVDGPGQCLLRPTKLSWRLVNRHTLLDMQSVPISRDFSPVTEPELLCPNSQRIQVRNMAHRRVPQGRSSMRDRPPLLRLQDPARVDLHGLG